MILRFSMSEREQLVTFNRLKRGEITQKGAAKTLGFSTRWVRKKFKRFKEEGDSGLLHKSRGRSSPKKRSKEQVDFILSLFEGHFEDFGPTFAAKKLEELYQIKISKESLRKIMIQNGYWKAKRRKLKHRKMRERKKYYKEYYPIYSRYST